MAANAKFYLAGSLLELEETDEALSLFAEILLLPEGDRPPFPADLLLRLDKLYYGRNRYDVSEAICRWLLDHADPNVVYQASLRLVRNLSGQNRLTDAESFLNTLLKRVDDPTAVAGAIVREGARVELMSLLSEVYFLQEKYCQAVGAVLPWSALWVTL